MQRKKRPLRSPFVMTFAAAATTAIACGGQVEGPEKKNPEDTRGTTSVPNADSCPSVAPAGGASCALPASQVCTYGNCYGVAITRVQCSSARTWQVVEATCNPPPPPMNACPRTEPKAGASCATFADLQCVYNGSRCNEAGGYEPERHYSCGSGVWVAQPAPECVPPVPTCPSSPPNDGARCTGDLVCPYGDCYGSPTTTARCSTQAGRWSVFTSTCNPPALDAGR